MLATPSHDLNVRKSSTRPAASALQGANGSPITPLSRSVSGLYGSPGSSFRVDEENLLIFDIGSRYTRAGFAGEATPRCSINHSPNLWRRIGDYRTVDPAYENKPLKRRKDWTWGEEHELWRPQLRDLVNDRDLDLGLVEDKLDRLIRECENKHLMLDSRTKKVTLVVPSSLPRPLLSLMLKRIFEQLQAPSVTLLPTSVPVAVGAGLRSALVVELGWHETTVTAVYEYREVLQKKSVRAGKTLSEHFRLLLDDELGHATRNTRGKGTLTFNQVEEVMTRVGWCRGRDPSRHEDTDTSIPLSTSHGSTILNIPFSRLADPADTALFASETDSNIIDDEGLPLHHLLYNALLKLPIDIRRICMSRILLTGGIANLPGLKKRILQELEVLIKERGWNPVRNYGSAKKQPHKLAILGERDSNIQSLSLAEPTKLSELTRTTSSTSSTSEVASHIPASLQPHDVDPVAEKVARLTVKDALPQAVEGKIRALNTLGAWAGASLMVNLRVKGAVEIEKDRFMQYGLVGGGKKDGVEGKGRQSLAPAGMAGKGAAGERRSWGLGVWA